MNNQRGFSLIELMVALVISLFMSLASITVAKGFGEVRASSARISQAASSTHLTVSRLLLDAEASFMGIDSAVCTSVTAGGATIPSTLAGGSEITFFVPVSAEAATSIEITGGVLPRPLWGRSGFGFVHVPTGSKACALFTSASITAAGALTSCKKGTAAAACPSSGSIRIVSREDQYLAGGGGTVTTQVSPLARRLYVANCPAPDASVKCLLTQDYLSTAPAFIELKGVNSLTVSPTGGRSYAVTVELDPKITGCLKVSSAQPVVDPFNNCTQSLRLVR